MTLASGATAVLKVSMPHMEGEHEIEGLRFWSGDPTVRLLAGDDDLGAMLLERCEPGTALRSLAEPEQDVVIARLLRRIWRVPIAPHPFRPLSEMTAHWSDETLAQAEHWPDTGLVREGLRLFKELPQSAPSHPLLATDLHAGNVLRADREPWLVIDPKPFLGDPTYDATQHLLNCSARLRSDPENTIRRVADLLDIDPARVRLWMFARAAAEPREDWKDDWLVGLARVIAMQRLMISRQATPESPSGFRKPSRRSEVPAAVDRYQGWPPTLCRLCSGGDAGRSEELDAAMRRSSTLEVSPFATDAVCSDEREAWTKEDQMAMTTTAPADAAQTADRLRIDFLFLDLTTCSRCRGTDRNLESALEVVRDLLEATGIKVEVNKIHVESAEQARELRFVSSPTIRVNGSDIALELRESLCGCDACTDGCGEGISCRVWVHHGREYTEAPAALIVDAILRQVYGRAAEREPAAEPYELPENLERFFAGQSPGPSSRGAGGNKLLPAGTEETSCCSPGQQRSCCDPKDEAECCGASTREGLGCR